MRLVLLGRLAVIVLSVLVLWAPRSTAHAQSCAQICQQYLNYARGAGSPGTYGPLMQLYQQCMACRRGGGQSYQSPPTYHAPRCPSGYELTANGCEQVGDRCGNGQFCRAGSVCYSIPNDVADRLERHGFARRGCITPEGKAALPEIIEAARLEAVEENEKRIQEEEERIREKLRRQKEKLQREREYREEKLQKTLAKKKDEIEQSRKQMDAERDKQLQSLIRKGRKKKTVHQPKSAKQLMQELRRDPLLDKLKRPGGKERKISKPSSPSLMPSRQTPAAHPIKPLPKNRETQKLTKKTPAPKIAKPEGQFANKRSTSGGSAVQNWISGGDQAVIRNKRRLAGLRTRTPEEQKARIANARRELQAAFALQSQTETQNHANLLKSEIFIRYVDKATGMWLGPLYKVVRKGADTALGQTSALEAGAELTIKLGSKKAAKMLIEPVTEAGGRAAQIVVGNSIYLFDAKDVYDIFKYYEGQRIE